MEHRYTNLNHLRDSIRVASYDVDPVAVADAIVRRRWSVAIVSHPAVRPASASLRHSHAQVSRVAGRNISMRTRALAA